MRQLMDDSTEIIHIILEIFFTGQDLVANCCRWVTVLVIIKTSLFFENYRNMFGWFKRIKNKFLFNLLVIFLQSDGIFLANSAIAGVSKVSTEHCEFCE